MTEERVPERQAATIPPGEEVLGQFLGDEAFPVTWASEVEKQLFWVSLLLSVATFLGSLYVVRDLL